MNHVSPSLLVEGALISTSLIIIFTGIWMVWPPRKKPRSHMDVDTAVRNAPYHLLEEIGIHVAPLPTSG